MKVKSEREVAQSCPTLSDPMDCSLPGSSIHGIFLGLFNSVVSYLESADSTSFSRKEVVTGMAFRLAGLHMKSMLEAGWLLSLGISKH